VDALVTVETILSELRESFDGMTWSVEGDAPFDIIVALPAGQGDRLIIEGRAEQSDVRLMFVQNLVIDYVPLAELHPLLSAYLSGRVTMTSYARWFRRSRPPVVTMRINGENGEGWDAV
jgi:hypothetical protein